MWWIKKSALELLGIFAFFAPLKFTPSTHSSLELLIPKQERLGMWVHFDMKIVNTVNKLHWIA